jgi:hypothetical protein
MAIAVIAFVALTASAQTRVIKDPFPSINCDAYDTHVFTWKDTAACQSFQQLVKAKDPDLLLNVGPVYACFGVNDELFVIDTALDLVRSDDKKYTAIAKPTVSFYKNGIETGIKFLSPMTGVFMDGGWSGFSPDSMVYSGQTTKLAEDNGVPHTTMLISSSTIEFGDWRIQTSTGRFSYKTSLTGKPVQIAGQCAIFKKDTRIELSPNGNTAHTYWRQIN